MSSKTTVPAKPAAEVQVVLNKPHTHRGEQLKAGATINVNAKDQVWLEKRGLIGGKQEEVIHG